MKQVNTLGVACALGGNHSGCGEGPKRLRDSSSFHHALMSKNIQLAWGPLLQANKQLTQPDALQELCARIAKRSQVMIKQETPALFISGEHSYAMGIWQGVMSALAPKKLGLIWVDAHMDAHTFLTSASGHVHGMPVAALLGKGDEKLQQIYGHGLTLCADSLAMIGVRSFERQEADLLNRLHVKQVAMTDLTSGLSLKKHFKKLRDHVLQNSDYFAISIDVDAIDPKDAPAVGVPESAGIKGEALCEALRQFKTDPLFVGAEISEFSPEFDQENKTLMLIAQIISSLYGP